MDKLPISTNGKVDRNNLPAPEGDRTGSTGTFVAPRTETEETLAGIWQRLLGIDHIGVEENFFNLGGHSLLATRVISRVRDAFEIELPLRTLFEAPTIGALASRLETLRWAAEARNVTSAVELTGHEITLVEERF
jgi:acyl carrier protein